MNPMCHPRMPPINSGVVTLASSARGPDSCPDMTALKQIVQGPVVQNLPQSFLAWTQPCRQACLLRTLQGLLVAPSNHLSLVMFTALLRELEATIIKIIIIILSYPEFPCSSFPLSFSPGKTPTPVKFCSSCSGPAPRQVDVAV